MKVCKFSVFFLFSMGILPLYEKGSKAVVLYGAVPGAQYLTVATSARNYGIRFVENVLVEESHSIWSGKAGSSRQRYCDGKGLAMLVIELRR